MNQSTHTPARLHLLAWLVTGLLAGAVIGWFFIDSSLTYLGLQARSDHVHRVAVITLPTTVVILMICWLLAPLARRGKAWRMSGRVLAILTAGLLAATATHVVRFDRLLESAGLFGQRFGPESTAEDADSDLRFRCEPGPDYDDDVVIRAVDAASGAQRWRWHQLGRGCFQPTGGHGLLVAGVQRISTASVHLFESDTGHKRWAVLLHGHLKAEPRLTKQGVVVLRDDQLLLLALEDGHTQQIHPGCDPASGFPVACEAGRVVGWSRGDQP